MSYDKCLIQKYLIEYEELKRLLNQMPKINGFYNKYMNQYKAVVCLAEMPDLLFGFKSILISTVWSIIFNIKNLKPNLNFDEYNLIKLNEALNLILRGYKLSEQENNAICNTLSLPRVTPTERYVYNCREQYMQNYLRQKLLPYWQDKLSPECIKFIHTQYNENINKNNEFIAKEDLLNEVYFINPKPHNWREQLTAAGIPVDVV